MANVKKISDTQFTLDCINKEFAVIGSDIHFNTYEDLLLYAKSNLNWFSEHSFKTLDEFKRWREYFFEHFYDWKPQRYSKKVIENEFRWFNLQFGFSYGFDLSELKNL